MLDDIPLGVKLEAMTVEASLAAARGEWDLVMARYQERGALLQQNTRISPGAIARMQALDQDVAEHARLAQAGLAAMLEDAGHVRQRLRGLRQWQGGVPADAGLMTRHL